MEIPNKLTIHVTQQDIDKGKRGSYEHCAIAKAVRRQFRGKLIAPTSSGFNRPVAVGAASVRINFKNGSYASYRLSDRAGRFIDKFDTNKKGVRPANFTLPLANSYEQ